MHDTPAAHPPQNLSSLNSARLAQIVVLPSHPEGRPVGLVFVVCKRLRWRIAVVGSGDDVVHLPPMAKDRWRVADENEPPA